MCRRRTAIRQCRPSWHQPRRRRSRPQPFAPLADTANKYAAYMVSDEHFAHQDEDGHDVVWRVLQTDFDADVEQQRSAAEARYRRAQEVR